MTLSEGGNVKNERYSQSAKQAMRKWVVNLSQLLKNIKTKTIDVKCWDRTRVVLNWPPNNGNDFIHANWIKHELLENIFICCQDFRNFCKTSTKGNKFFLFHCRIDNRARIDLFCRDAK
uniref:Tyrosine-protein phosphatase domain-containing protein n=1 Tax=Parascaris equorum TaxID=6256 RepID=A0A914S118_PAREQ